MKKIVFVLLMGITYYIAGMYQYQSLMVLFLAECFIFVGMYVLVKYFKWGLSVELEKRNEFAEKNETIRCGIKIKNKGRLPISRFKLRIRCEYNNKETIVRNLYGGSECGEEFVHYEIEPRYCGILQTKLVFLQVYDYMALFSARTKLKEEMKIAVFPAERRMNIELPAFASSRSYQHQLMTTDYTRDASYEVRQIREYQEGDSRRHIHWNQSARTDKIWMKEYEKEADNHVEFYLDTTGFEKAKEERRDAFYELLSAMVMGMLQKVPVVWVYWYEDQQNGLHVKEISNYEQCKEMLYLFYNMVHEKKNRVTIESRQEELRMDMESAFRLDIELRWYQGEKLIYQFTQESLEQEIEQKLFVIWG